MPKISVIVPVYKVEKYIRRCVNSILAQTFTDFELILVDDGSPDNCGAICDEYARLDKRIKVIHQQNLGQASARNNALREAAGEWICYVDSDDVVHPQLLEVLFGAIKKHQCLISICGAIEDSALPEFFWNGANSNSVIQTVNEAYLFDLFETDHYSPWVVWAKLINRNIIEQIPFCDGKVYEDIAVVPQWLYTAKRIAWITSPLYFYQINPSGTTKSMFSPKKLDSLWALEENAVYFREKKYTMLKEMFCKMYLDKACSLRWEAINSPKYKEYASEIGKKMRIFCKRFHALGLITKEKKLNIYDAMFPNIMQGYWLACAAGNYLKSYGIIQTAKRIVSRCIGGE